MNETADSIVNATMLDVIRRMNAFIQADPERARLYQLWCQTYQPDKDQIGGNYPRGTNGQHIRGHIR